MPPPRPTRSWYRTTSPDALEGRRGAAPARGSVGPAVGRPRVGAPAAGVGVDEAPDALEQLAHRVLRKCLLLGTAGALDLDVTGAGKAQDDATRQRREPIGHVRKRQRVKGSAGRDFGP